jgi:photosystem II stability/assembly factor-like uncharacterized protein
MKPLKIVSSLLLAFLILYPHNFIFPQAYWQQINGAISGSVNALGLDMNGRIFAWSDINALYLSTNDGNTWSITPLQTTDVNSIFITSSNFIWTGGNLGKVYLSTDHGDSWLLKNNGIFYNDDIVTMAENSSGLIYAGAKCELLSGDGGGVYLSSNNGDSWNFIGLLNHDVFSLTINTSNHIYAAHSMGISKSTDGGNNWFYINNGLQQYDVINAIAVAPNGYLFAGSWEWGGGIYRSTDSGQSWTQINLGLPADNVTSLLIKANGYIFAAYENSGIFRSTTNGSSWQDVSLSLNSDVAALDLNQSGHIYAAIPSDGIYKSLSNGDFWNKITNGIINLYITAIANNTNGDILAGTDGGGLYVSTNQGTNWIHLDISYYEDYTIHDFLTNSQGHIFAALGVYIYPEVARSTNGGYSWSSASSGIIDDAIQCLNVDHNGFLYAGGFQKVYISTNNGEHWNYVTNGLPNRWVFAVAVNLSNHIFAGTYGGGLYRSTNYGNTFIAINNGIGDNWFYSLAIDSVGNIFAGNRQGVYYSTDNGDSWVLLTNGITNPGFVYEIIIDSEQNIYVGASEGLYFSSDNGSNWSHIDQGLEGTLMISLSLDSLGHIYAGTYDGVYKLMGEIPVELISFKAAIDGSTVTLDWSTATETNNQGFEILRYTQNDNDGWNKIGFVPGHGTTTETQHYSFTENNVKPGKYQYKLKQIDYDGTFEYSQIVEVEIPFVNEFSLSQNYPNPFNPTTSLQYAIGSRQFVTLKVYDILGREIAILVNEEKPAGEYEAEFNAANLPSGIYFYQLKAGQYSETKKMILLK